MLAWCTDAVAYLVVDNQLLLECLIGVEDVGRHPSCPGEGNNKRSDDLIEAFVDIDATSSDVGPSGVLEFKIKVGEVPPFLCPCSSNASKHGLVGPCADPLLQVLHPDGCP